MESVTFFNNALEEIGTGYVNADIETGDAKARNDIEITGTLPQGCAGIAILGTDAGGIVEYVKMETGQRTIYKALTWRGLLNKIVISPPAGQDYFTVSNKDLNEAIRGVLGTALGGFFTVPNHASGKTVSSYQFNRYVTALDGLSDMCASVGYKLYVHAEKSTEQKKILVYVEAKPIEVIEEAFDEASFLTIEFVDNRMQYTHFICMGKGELHERTRVDLYLQPDGSIGKTPSAVSSGFYDRQYYYDNSGAETITALENEGRKKFAELKNGRTLKLKKLNKNKEIGDIARGSFDYGNGIITVSRAISKKIYRISGDQINIEYAVEGE